MGCLSCCAKCILIFTNVWFMLFGLAFLGIGVLLKVGFEHIEDILKRFSIDIINLEGAKDLILDLGPLVNNIAITFIVAGCVIFIIAILGMCGACCENRCMLATYATIILILMIGDIVLVVLFATGQFNGKIKDSVKTMIREDFGGIDDLTAKSLVINFVQWSLQCCGVDNSTDFDDAVKWRRIWDAGDGGDTGGVQGNVTLVIPLTCCKSKFPDIRPLDEDCITAPTTNNSNKDSGCFQEVTMYITDEYRLYLVIVQSVYLADQFLLVVFAIYLAVQIGKRNKGKKGRYYEDNYEMTIKTRSTSRPRH